MGENLHFLLGEESLSFWNLVKKKNQKQEKNFRIFPSWLFCRMRQIYWSLLATQTRLTVVHYAKFLFLCSCKLNSFLIFISDQHHCHLLSWTCHVQCHGTVYNPWGISAKFCKVLHLHVFSIEQRGSRFVGPGLILCLINWNSNDTAAQSGLIYRPSPYLLCICPFFVNFLQLLKERQRYWLDRVCF